MDDMSLTVKIDESKSVTIAPLPRQTYKEAGGKGLGGEFGYFVYEVDTRRPQLGINIIAKAASLDGAMRLFDLLKNGRESEIT